jgi:endoglucanase
LVSGGPNSGLQDPIAKSAGLAGKAPQRCFIDHIESYSTNEVAINWNAPLAWIAAFLDDTARSAH